MTRQASLPSLSVILSTYGRRDNLPLVIPPLLAQQAVTEFVFIVNGSRDGSLQYFEGIAAADARVRPLFLDNQGLTRAQWVGAVEARNDVLLFLDDDVLVSRDLAAGHARHHAARRGLLVAGYMPTRVPERRGPDHYTTELYALEYDKVVASWEADPDNILTKLWMGNTSIRRADYLALRPHETAPELRYHQDQHLGILAKRAGLTGVFDRSLHADHIHVRSLEAFVGQARRQGGDQQVLHRLHAEVLGPFDPRTFERRLPLPARLMVRYSKMRVVHRLSSAALKVVVRAAGRCRWYRLQMQAARLLRRVELRRGASEATPKPPL